MANYSRIRPTEWNRCTDGSKNGFAEKYPSQPCQREANDTNTIKLNGRQFHKDDAIAYRDLDNPGPISPTRSKAFTSLLIKRRGIFWILVSVLSSTLSSLCVKLLAGQIPAGEVLFFRGIFQILFAAPHLVFRKVSLRFSMKLYALIAARAFVGTFLSFSSYFAFQTLPIASAKALIYSSPLFTGFFASACLKERCSIWTISFSFLTVFAVVLIVQPPFLFGGGNTSNRNMGGILFAVNGAIMAAINVIILKSLQNRRVHPQAIIFIYGFIAMFCSIVITTALGEWTNPDCGFTRLVIIGMCLTGFLDQVSQTLALKTEQASVVAIVRSNDVLVSFLCDYLIFSDIPNALTVLGALGVVGCAMGMTITSHFSKNSVPSLSKRNKGFSFLRIK